MYYKAQANVFSDNVMVYKDQAVTKDVFDSLPERLKIKFVAHSEESDVRPKGFNEIVGDNPAEKAKREQLAKEDALAKKKHGK